MMLDIAAAYHTYAARLRRYVSARVSDPHVVDDILGAVWLDVCEHAPAYEERGYPVSAWLYCIARSRIIDAHRVASRNPTTPLAADTARVDAPAADRLDNARAARRALAAMLPDQARACYLRYACDYSADDVARMMGRTNGAVKSLLVRGKQRARALNVRQQTSAARCSPWRGSCRRM